MLISQKKPVHFSNMFIESHNSLDIIHEDLNNEHEVKVNIFPKVCLEFIKLKMKE